MVIIATGLALESSQLEHPVAEAFARRCVPKDAVALRCDLDELCASNRGGAHVPFRDRCDAVATRMQHQRRCSNFAEQSRDVECTSRLEQFGRYLRRQSLATDIVEPSELFICSPGNEP